MKSFAESVKTYCKSQAASYSPLLAALDEARKAVKKKSKGKDCDCPTDKKALASKFHKFSKKNK